jgi:hypothetical protein
MPDMKWHNPKNHDCIWASGGNRCTCPEPKAQVDIATALDAIVTLQTTEPRELPRLTTGNVFLTFAHLGQALERAAAAYKHLPNDTPLRASDTLKEIVKECETMTKYAQRLLEANQ